MKRTRPTCILGPLESLGERVLLSGISTSVVRGVLTIRGDGSSEPIIVTFLPGSFPRRGMATVAIDGVARYPAARVRRVVVLAERDQPVSVRRFARWRLPVSVVQPPPVASASLPEIVPTAARPGSMASAPAPPMPSVPVLADPMPLPGPLPPLGTLSGVEAQLVASTNEYRVANGLGTLRVDARLVMAAQLHARNMARLGSLAHELPGADLPRLGDRAAYVAYSVAFLGENIQATRAGLTSVVRNFANSPGHRDNLLRPEAQDVGFGLAWGADGLPYYCQLIGRSR